MRRALAVLSVATLTCLLALPAQATPTVPASLHLPAAPDAMTEAQWDAFSQNLRVALASEHEGLQAGAMQMVIRYGAHLDVDGAAFDVVRIYRSHSNQQMRRLAVVTCRQLGSRWALGFLRMSERFERDPALRATIRSVLAEQVG